MIVFIFPFSSPILPIFINHGPKLTIPFKSKNGIFFLRILLLFSLFLNSPMMSIKPHHVQCFPKCIFKMNGHFRVSIFHGIVKDPLLLLEEWLGFPIATTMYHYVLWFFSILFVEEYLMRSNKIYGTENTWMKTVSYHCKGE